MARRAARAVKFTFSISARTSRSMRPSRLGAAMLRSSARLCSSWMYCGGQTRKEEDGMQAKGEFGFTRGDAAPCGSRKHCTGEQLAGGHYKTNQDPAAIKSHPQVAVAQRRQELGLMLEQRGQPGAGKLPQRAVRDGTHCRWEGQSLVGAVAGRFSGAAGPLPGPRCGVGKSRRRRRMQLSCSCAGCASILTCVQA